MSPKRQRRCFGGRCADYGREDGPIGSVKSEVELEVEDR